MVAVGSPASTSSLERALERERECSRALREVGLLLDSTVPRDQLLRRVLSVSARVTDAERATLYLVQPGTESLVSHATEGGGDERIVLPIGLGIAGTCARERRTVAVADAYGDPRFEPIWDKRTGYRTRSVMAAPMLTPDGHVVGVLQVLNRRDQSAFDRHDVEMLEALAAQAAVAIEGARHLEAIVANNRDLHELREQLERSLRERNLLLEIEQLLSRSDSLDEFLDGALVGLMRECNAEAGAVLIREHASQRLVFRAVRGADAALRGTTPESNTVAARVASTGDAVLCTDCASHCDGDAVSSLPGAPPESLAVVPLPGEHASIGVIELRNHSRGKFAEADLALLTLVAANVSTGVELAHARDERERSGRLAAVGRILTNVLHDLRAPMTVISGYAQLMPDTDDAAERERLAKAIVKQFGNIQAMIGELLAFVRGESQLLLAKVWLEPFFSELVESLRHDVGARGVQVELDLRDRSFARFDPAKVTRMVHNLARNAAEAIAPRGQGHFRIQVERDGNELVMRFDDDGPGIPDAVRPALFESFVTSGKRGGSGLGLPIVKRVVDEHNGRLDVQTGQNGTRFEIRLPVKGPSTSSLPPSAQGVLRDPH